jgi:2'-5' RNA ligase
VSPEVRESIMVVEERLAQTRADIKLVERENLHFTVKFLGEVPESITAEISERLAALSLEKMEVEVKGIGAFPDARRPRVIWAGIAPQDLEAASAAGQRIVDALEGIGERDERELHLHITLARVRSPRNLDALTAVVRDLSSKSFGKTMITSLKLKSSSLSAQGPAYTDVREYPLK